MNYRSISTSFFNFLFKYYKCCIKLRVGDDIIRKTNYKVLLLSILVPIILGGIIGFITGTSNQFETMIKPSFAPPAILFPIVWTILYALMGISFYLVLTSNGDNEGAIKIYILQLIVNLIWPIIFFSLRLYLIAFLWLIFLIILIVIMIYRFYKLNKLSAYLQVPYLLWCIFASVLNLAIYFLN